MAEPNQTRFLQGALILIVDDTPQNLKLLRYILSTAGGQILEASSAAEARSLLSSHLPDVILLDVVMPGTDGYELCQEIKASPETSHIPIIFLSALHEPVDKLRAFSAGGADYVSKPFDATEVLARVTHHFRTIRMQRELEREKERLAMMNRELLRAQERTIEVFGALAHNLTGKVLDGKYELEEQIGSGGFAVVYRALAYAWRKAVAVKVLRPMGNLSAEKRVMRFRQEGVSACRVNHINAVAVLDSGSSEGINYLVMELLNGHPLSAEIGAGKPLPLERCIQIIVPVCEVLIEAHASGVIHRDIKPDNVFLHQGKAGEVVKVLDFGIAKLIDDEEDPRQPLTSPGELIGTPMYMSPEQLMGDSYDGRADVYSIGIMMYEMLCGQLPFPASRESPLRVLISQINRTMPRIACANPSVPTVIEDVVMAALSKDPAQRPTAAEFLDSLLAAAQSLYGASEVERLLDPSSRISKHALKQGAGQ